MPTTIKLTFDGESCHAEGATDSSCPLQTRKLPPPAPAACLLIPGLQCVFGSRFPDPPEECPLRRGPVHATIEATGDAEPSRIIKPLPGQRF